MSSSLKQLIKHMTSSLKHFNLTCLTHYNMSATCLTHCKLQPRSPSFKRFTSHVSLTTTLQPTCLSYLNTSAHISSLKQTKFPCVISTCMEKHKLIIKRLRNMTIGHFLVFSFVFLRLPFTHGAVFCLA